jgi:hypothetical protein
MHDKDYVACFHARRLPLPADVLADGAPACEEMSGYLSILKRMRPVLENGPLFVGRAYIHQEQA